MTATNALADLDELVLLCRDDKARVYIAEAVACYRAGAFRSAIVATWIAVCYDIIDKLRELALAGDKAAEQYIKKIEQARSSTDFSAALKIERELLDLARDQFELISHLEHVDLYRLQEDRNRCAHPSLISEDQAFHPSGELARLHIRSAVLHLLQHQPVQGKYALERLLREVNSQYFPTEADKAAAALSSGPLKRPRESLVRNFMIVLVKDIVNPPVDWKPRNRALAALGAVKQMHHSIFQKTIGEQLPLIFRSLPDETLIRAIDILQAVDCWYILPNDVRSKMERFVDGLPSEKFIYIESILNYAPLREHAEGRARRASREDLLSAPFWNFPAVVSDRVVDLYLACPNYAQANELGLRVVSMYAADFSADQQRRILSGIHKNSQLLYSVELSTVISSLRQTKRISPEEFEKLLESNGLKQYMIGPKESA
jgi:hypothetical protein